MSVTKIIILVGVIVGVVVIGWWALLHATPPGLRSPVSSSSTPVISENSVSTPEISFHYPSDFGLAVKPEQILTKSYIPPCELENFDYCLYYTGPDYRESNFESAGVRIKRRLDLMAERLCLTTPPAGYASLAPANTTSSDQYATSVFRPLADAATGHSARGELYRLYLRNSNSCFEFETRIGQSQFVNYPPGTITEFTARDQAALANRLRQLLGSVVLAGGGRISFPQ
jgi:hypothetical protein